MTILELAVDRGGSLVVGGECWVGGLALKPLYLGLGFEDCLFDAVAIRLEFLRELGGLGRVLNGRCTR